MPDTSVGLMINQEGILKSSVGRGIGLESCEEDDLVDLINREKPG